MSKKLTKELINKWKEEYKHIYRVTIQGEDIFFRRLKRSEYINILKESGEIDATDANDIKDKSFVRQEKILLSTIVYPEDVTSLIEDSAGIATVLSDEILSKSGFVNIISEEL